LEGLFDLSSLRHVGFVIPNLEGAITFYEKMGVGPFKIFQPEYHEISYLGRQGNFRMKVAIASFGPIEIELIEPLAGESVYNQFLKERGGGIHHLAFDVSDLDGVAEKFKSLGVDVVMSGARKGLRFAYLNAKQGALILELIERNE
jgi:4-hydroxyphenylpyruvate dioxygenase-like putative hemolysin